MHRRNSQKEDFGLGWIHVDVDPSSPCCQTFVEQNETVHVFVQLVTLLNIVPSAMQQYKKQLFLIP